MIAMADNGEDNVMRIGKRCYVGNLAWKTSWQDLKDKFRECGDVAYANVMRDEEGRSKGWGIVEFQTPEEAVHAVNTLNGIELHGRKMMVREDREDRDVKQYNQENGLRSPKSRGRGRGTRGGRSRDADGQAQGEGQSSGLQIVVQGIPWKYDWKELKDMFQEIGDVDRADVAFSSSGRSRGYGTVRFLNAEAAQNAIDRFHGTTLEGRTLTVFLDKFA